MVHSAPLNLKKKERWRERERERKIQGKTERKTEIVIQRDRKEGKETRERVRGGEENKFEEGYNDDDDYGGRELQQLQQKRCCSRGVAAKAFFASQ